MSRNRACEKVGRVDWDLVVTDLEAERERVRRYLEEIGLAIAHARRQAVVQLSPTFPGWAQSLTPSQIAVTPSPWGKRVTEALTRCGFYPMTAATERTRGPKKR